jgi:hypothetical protein
VIPPFAELARKGGVNISDTKGLLTLTVPCRLPSSTDLSFSKRRRSLLASIFRGPDRISISDGLFVFGSSAALLAPIVRGNEQLCDALQILCVQFVCRVDCNRDTVRVQIGVGVPASDSTGGNRFLSSLIQVARSMEDITRNIG